MAARKGSKSCQEDDSDNTEKLITKVCQNFSKQLEIRMDDRFDKIDKKLTEMSNSMKTLHTMVTTNSKSISKLEEKYDILEQYTKRNTLRILGIEEREEEDVADTVIHFFTSKLRVPCCINDIDSVFRVGKRSSGNVKPRTILINFIQNSKRNEILNNRNQLKNTGYTIFEDLTAHRYDLLSAAKKKFGKNKAWSSGGKVFMWNDRQKKKVLVNSENDL